MLFFISTFWTFSKLLPYILSLVGGIFFAYTFSKIQSKFGRLKYIIWLIPFLIYFSIHPIYEGDFSNNSTSKSSKSLPLKDKSSQLIVVVIPGCPFCFSSIQTMKEFHARNSNLRIRYIVCSSENKDLAVYKKEINGAFTIENTNEPKKWAKFVNGRFPSFVYVNKAKVQIWSNDGFGVIAKDEIESSLKESFN